MAHRGGLGDSRKPPLLLKRKIAGSAFPVQKLRTNGLGLWACSKAPGVPSLPPLHVLGDCVDLSGILAPAPKLGAVLRCICCVGGQGGKCALSLRVHPK